MSLKELSKGQTIRFLGYGDDVPEDERLLTEGEEYEVASVDLKKKEVCVEIPNPDFNSKKRVSEDNPEFLEVPLFEEEFEVVAQTEGEGEGEGEGESEGEEAPVRGRRAAKTAAKTKTANVPAKAKGKAEKAAAEEAPPETDEEALESEDEDVVKLIEEADDILALAQEMASEANVMDYRLGGILYHIRLDKAYEKLDKRYKEKGGFELYVQEHLSIEYRKAMALKDIYIAANKFGIDAETIAEIGWTKAWKIAQVADKKNVKSLVKLAKNSTVSDLVENIKVNYKPVGPGGARNTGEKKKLITFKFRLFEDSAETVTATIEQCMKSMGFARMDDAFEHIVTEWGTEHAATKATTAKAGKKVEAPSAAPARRPAKTAARSRG